MRKGSWIQCLRSSDRAPLRLFCFPHGGGSAHSYRHWAEYVHQDVEVFAIQPPGRGPRQAEPAITGMTDYVDALVDELIPHLSKCYVLFGHSVGALVAYAVALKLREKGLLDHCLHVYVSGHVAPSLNAQETENIVYHKLPDKEFLEHIRDWGVTPPEILESKDWQSLILPIMRADFALSETYEYAALDVPMNTTISVYGGTEDVPVPEASLRSWMAETSRAGKVNMIAGDHFYLLGNKDVFFRHLNEELVDDVHSAVEWSTALRTQWNERTEYYPSKPLHELFRDAAAANADKIAVVDVVGSETREFTFSQLDADSDRFAKILVARGVQRGDIVGIFMDKTYEFIVSYIAVLKAGGAYFPIELAYPHALLRTVLGDAKPPAVFTKAAFSSRLLEDDVAYSGHVVVVDDETSLRAVDTSHVDLAAVTVGLDDLAYCVFSSGSTGVPKGILCPHRGSVMSYNWRHVYWPFIDADRIGVNVFFVWECLRPLLRGFPTYCISDDVLLDPRALITYFNEHRITRVLLTPSLLTAILDAMPAKQSLAIPSMRLVWLCGEVVTEQLRLRALQALPGVHLVNLYSISECHDVSGTDLLHGDAVSEYCNVGHLFKNVKMVVLGDDMAPVPVGCAGETYVGGAGLACEYLNRPELTSQRFVTFAGERWYRTGDAGRQLPDGSFEIIGRCDFFVKLRGYSIYLGAVEVACMQHEGIKSAAVCVVNKGEAQDEELVAFIVTDGRELTRMEMCAFLRQHLPEYSIPTRYYRVETLPTHAASGKLDKRTLLTLIDSACELPVAKTMVAPSSPMEQLLAELFSELLKMDARQVDPLADFYVLGAHSLLLAQAVQMIKQRLRGAETLTVTALLQYRTVQTLAAFLESIHCTPAAAPENASSSQLSDASESLSSSQSSSDAADDGSARDIAIVGMSLRVPGADTVEGFWRDILCGMHDCAVSLSDTELRACGIPDELIASRDYVRRVYPISGSEHIYSFEPEFFGMSETEARFTDPQHRLFLESCYHALEDAAIDPWSYTGTVGVYGGCFINTYAAAEDVHLPALDNPALGLIHEVGHDKDYLCTRVAYTLNLRGPAVTIQTSCSTSLVAVSHAVDAIRLGKCDVALAGASSVRCPPYGGAGYLFQSGMVQSADGVCRVFDDKASGTVFSDAVVSVVLMPVERAVEQRRSVYAVIKGTGCAQDGADKAGGFSAPSVSGQVAAIRAALTDANVAPGSLQFVEAHGTGTIVGDPIEFEALRAVFGARDAPLAVGSVKGSFGHTNIAAGMVGLAKAALAVQRATIPPTLHFHAVNRNITLGTAFDIPHGAPLPWPAMQSMPETGVRRAGVNCLGVGGTNAFAVVESFHREDEGGECVDGDGDERVGMYLLSALSPESLHRMAIQHVDRVRAWMSDDADDDAKAKRSWSKTLALRTAYTLMHGRRQFPHRIAVPFRSLPDLCAGLQRAATADRNAAVTTAPIVALFPGQGSQYDGVGVQLYAERCGEFAAVVDRCVASVRAEGGFEAVADALHDYFRGEHEADVHDALFVQSRLVIVEIALHDALAAMGVRFAAVAGHSLGQFSAAYAAGVYTLDETLRMVLHRARCIQEHALPGAMLSVSVSFEHPALRDLLRRFPSVALAAINSARHCVVSGTADDIARCERFLRDELPAVKLRTLHVTHGFHCPQLLQRAAAAFADWMNTADNAPSARLPTTRVVDNTTGRLLSAANPATPEMWVTHLTGTVRWMDCQSTLCSVFEHARPLFLEIGPGTTLTTLLGTHVEIESNMDPHGILAMLPAPRSRRSTTAGERESEPSEVMRFFTALGQAWSHGLRVDWKSEAYEAYIPPAAKHFVHELPAYPFNRRVLKGVGDLLGNSKSALQPHQSHPESHHDAVAIGAAREKLPLADWTHVQSWTRIPVPRSSSLLTSETAVPLLLLFLDCSSRSLRLLQAVVAAKSAALYRVYLLRDDDGTVLGGQDSHAAILAYCEARGITVVAVPLADAGDDVDDDEIARITAVIDDEHAVQTVSIIYAWSAAPILDRHDAVSTPSATALPRTDLAVSFDMPNAVLAAVLGSRVDVGTVHMLTAGSVAPPGADGDAPLRPMRACLHAVAMVWSQEFRDRLRIQVVDLADWVHCVAMNGSTTAETIAFQLCARQVSELHAAPERCHPLLVVARNAVWCPAFEPIESLPHQSAGSPRRAAGRLCIVTGGLGRIGLALCEHAIANKSHTVVALLSRKKGLRECSAEVRERIATLRTRGHGSGVSVRVFFGVDVASAGRMSDVFGDLACALDASALHTVYHAAGIADLQLINDAGDRRETTQMHTQRLQSELGAKVVGALNVRRCIEQSFRTSPSVSIVCFSSLAAVLGGLGMLSYSSANRVLDALCFNFNRDPQTNTRCRWQSINWDDWQFDYTKEQLTPYLRTQAAFSMTVAEGLRMLDALECLYELDARDLAGTPSVSMYEAVIVSTQSLSQRWHSWVRFSSAAPSPVTATQPPANGAVARGDPRTAAVRSAADDHDHSVVPVDRRILDIYASILGVKVDMHSDFYSAGGDSLLATQLVRALRKQLGMPVPLQLVLDSSRVADVVAWAMAHANSEMVPSRHS